MTAAGLEPCRRCPHAMRCAHYDGDRVRLYYSPHGHYDLYGPRKARDNPYYGARPTLAEAEAEFARRDALLRSEA